MQHAPFQYSRSVPAIFTPEQAPYTPTEACPYIQKFEIAGGIVTVPNRALKPANLRCLIFNALGLGDPEIASATGSDLVTVGELQAESKAQLGAKTRAHMVTRCIEEEILYVQKKVMGPELTPRQMDILGLTAMGLTMPQITDVFTERFRSPDDPYNIETISSHQYAARTRLGGPTNMSAVLLGHVYGLLPHEPFSVRQKPEVPQEVTIPQLPQPTEEIRIAEAPALAPIPAQQTSPERRPDIPRYTYEEWVRMFFPFDPNL
jgi:hypothetical protein